MEKVLIEIKAKASTFLQEATSVNLRRHMIQKGAYSIIPGRKCPFFLKTRPQEAHTDNGCEENAINSSCCCLKSSNHIATVVGHNNPNFVQWYVSFLQHLSGADLEIYEWWFCHICARSARENLRPRPLLLRPRPLYAH